MANVANRTRQSHNQTNGNVLDNKSPLIQVDFSDIDWHSETNVEKRQLWISLTAWLFACCKSLAERSIVKNMMQSKINWKEFDDEDDDEDDILFANVAEIKFREFINHTTQKKHDEAYYCNEYRQRTFGIYFHGTNPYVWNHIQKYGLSSEKKPYKLEPLEEIATILNKYDKHITGPWYDNQHSGTIFVTLEPRNAVEYAQQSPEWFTISSKKLEGDAYYNHDSSDLKNVLDGIQLTLAEWKVSSLDQEIILKNYSYYWKLFRANLKYEVFIVIHTQETYNKKKDKQRQKIHSLNLLISDDIELDNVTLQVKHLSHATFTAMFLPID